MTPVIDASAASAPVILDADVCIVGSGAGGAVLAAGLAARGLSVVVLEEGGHYERRDFSQRESDAFPALYQERGGRATADLAISVLQGRSVGGSTTINWTTCFRTPPRILTHWRDHHGLDLTEAELAPHFEAVEQRLSIQEWPSANPNNQKLADGCDALGWTWSRLRRNQKGCANSGFCGLGCPTNGKQAMNITYLADARQAGAQVVSRVRVDHVRHAGGRATGVVGRAMSPFAGAPDGQPVEVNARAVVSAAGALNGPLLLLRSGINPNDRVGKRTFLHPVVALFSRYADRIDGWFGAPQSIGSHQFVDRGADRVGYFFEVPPIQPMLTALSVNQFGEKMQALVPEFGNYGALISLCVDGLVDGDEGGTVTARSDGRLHLDYPIGPALQEAFRDAHRSMARIHLATGPIEASTLHVDPIRLRSEADLFRLDEAAYGAHEHAIFSAHQMGGCAMNGDPTRGVVDLRHRVHGFDNLFVVDGSVLPTALGVNPSQTIYGLAHRAAPFVAEVL